MRLKQALLMAICLLIAGLSGSGAKPLEQTEKITLGQSALGKPLVAWRVGVGKKALFVMGGIHGDEGLGVKSAQGFLDYLLDHPSYVPKGLRVYVLPALNVDARNPKSPRSVRYRRVNAHGVDLNRNWPTAQWTADVSYGGPEVYEGYGGTKPGSEPEVRALSRFILSLRSELGGANLLEISFHQYMQPPERPGSLMPGVTDAPDSGGHEYLACEYTKLFAGLTGYEYQETFDRYLTTGDFVTWAMENGMAAFDVEISNFREEDSVPMMVETLKQLLDAYGQS
jgi:hypothetical protein